MKFASLFVLGCMLYVSQCQNSTLDYKDYVHTAFSQQQDHFDLWSDAEFQQSFWINTKYYRVQAPNPSPILLFITAKYEYSDPLESLKLYGEAVEGIARDTMSTIIFVNARNSAISGDASRKTQTVEQILEDFIAFVDFYRISTGVPSPVVSIGVSHGADLAAFLRIRYPHLVVGAVTSSASYSLLVPDSVMLSSGVQQRLSNHYSEVAPEPCSIKIRQLLTYFNTTTTVEQLNQILDGFQICPTGGSLNGTLQLITEYYRGQLHALLQGNYPYAFGAYKAKPMENFCLNVMSQSTPDRVSTYKAFRSAFASVLVTPPADSCTNLTGKRVDNPEYQYFYCYLLPYNFIYTGLNGVCNETRKDIVRRQLRTKFGVPALSGLTNYISVYSSYYVLGAISNDKQSLTVQSGVNAVLMGNPLGQEDITFAYYRITVDIATWAKSGGGEIQKLAEKILAIINVKIPIAPQPHWAVPLLVLALLILSIVTLVIFKPSKDIYTYK